MMLLFVKGAMIDFDEVIQLDLKQEKVFLEITRSISLNSIACITLLFFLIVFA